MKKIIVFISLFISTSTFAQQQPNEQALGTKLIKEINEGLKCNSDLITIKDELAKAQAKIKELEDKK